MALMPMRLLCVPPAVRPGASLAVAVGLAVLSRPVEGGDFPHPTNLSNLNGN